MASAPGFLEIVRAPLALFLAALVGLPLAAHLFLAALSGLTLAAHSLAFFVSTVRHATYLLPSLAFTAFTTFTTFL
jgi:hypothetical protein